MGTPASSNFGNSNSMLCPGSNAILLDDPKKSAIAGGGASPIANHSRQYKKY
jgi:hypothetical protein